MSLPLFFEKDLALNNFDPIMKLVTYGLGSLSAVVEVVVNKSSSSSRAYIGIQSASIIAKGHFGR